MARMTMAGPPAPAPIDVDRERFLKDHFALPPLPAITQHLLSAIQSDEADATEIADLLATDPALVAQILKIVNSAYYGLPRQVTRVRHAVAYLGLAEIERLVMAATLMHEFPGSDDGRVEAVWHHAFFSALVSKTLTRGPLRNVDGEHLHSAVLLHDVGKLVYIKFFPDHYEAMQRHCESEGVLLADAERQFGYPSHGLLGALLCDRWRLPDTVEHACLHHELSDLVELAGDDPRRDATQLVCLSNLLSLLAQDTLCDRVKNALQRAVKQALDLAEERFLLLMGEVYALRSEVDAFLRQL